MAVPFLPLIIRGAIAAASAAAAYFTGKACWRESGAAELFTHYWCVGDNISCSRQLPDELVERALADRQVSYVECPTCRNFVIVKKADWEVMKNKRKKLKK